jgi:type I restriction enzyme M protein
MISRTQRELTAADIAQIADTYHAWRTNGDYEDIPGFCASATLDDIRAHNFVLTPGRYVGVEASTGDEIAFEDKMESLTQDWQRLMTQAHRLDASIEASLRELGYG